MSPLPPLQRELALRVARACVEHDEPCGPSTTRWLLQIIDDQHTDIGALVVELAARLTPDGEDADTPSTV